MKLSEQEKTWVKQISENKIQNFLDFGRESEFYDTSIERYVAEDQYKFKRYMFSFLALIQKLESEQLVFLAEKEQEASFGHLVYANKSHEYIDKYLNNLMTEHGTIEIIASEELKKFIENGFKTEEETALQKEIRDRKISQVLTVIVALVSIIASAFGS